MKYKTRNNSFLSDISGPVNEKGRPGDCFENRHISGIMDCFRKILMSVCVMTLLTGCMKWDYGDDPEDFDASAREKIGFLQNEDNFPGSA